jgi:hypothetical protein
MDTILATVVEIIAITEPKEKEKELGLKFKITVKSEKIVSVNGKDYTETHFYALKVKESSVKPNDKVVIEGRMWAMDDLKGFSNPKITKVG